MEHIAENILSYLDADSLEVAESVCTEWYRVISKGKLWKKLTECKVRTDSLWRTLFRRRKWIGHLFMPQPGEIRRSCHSFYRSLYQIAVNDIENTKNNWQNSMYKLTRIDCDSGRSKGVYCLQYDDDKIVCGLRDNTIKIWNLNELKCIKILSGHTGSVLCLQYDDKVIISGSSDATIRVWNLHTGEEINTYIHHYEAVLHLRFENCMMVTCSRVNSNSTK